MKSIPRHTLDFLDSWLKYGQQNSDVPGLCVAIAKDGDILFNKSYGHSDIETQETLKPEHIFRIASHSKTFTATAVMQLQEKRLLCIDDYVIDYLPWLKEHKDIRWSKVTIRQLLSHSAGVIRDGLSADYWQLKRPFPDKKTLQQEILKAELIYNANEKFKYSNFGYSLLGLIVENVSGQTYANYIDEHIVKPLGLKYTGSEPTEDQNALLAKAYGRVLINKKRERIHNVDTHAMAPATGFYSTAAELCMYFSAQMPGTGMLLDDSSKREMQRVQWQVENTASKERYGLGIELDQIGSRTVRGHGGGFPGHSTKSFFDNDDKLVIVVLTNCLNSNPSLIASGILSVIDYLGDVDPDRNLVKFEGRFASLWGVQQIVVKGKELVSIFLGAAKPFEAFEKLEKINGNTLRTIEANGYEANGEMIHYTFDDNGNAKSIISAGTNMVTSETGEYHINES